MADDVFDDQNQPGGFGEKLHYLMRIQIVPADDGSGMVIQYAVPGGPATKLKDSSGSDYFLEPGDIISTVNGHPAGTLHDYIHAMNNAPNKHHIPMEHHLGGRQ